MTQTGYLLSDDMMFTSRVTGTARDLGFEIKVARSQDGIEALIRSQPPAAVIVDLANPGLNLPVLLATLKAANLASTMVAYGSHVDAETLKQARQAGCDAVLPRSQFAERLPDLLPQWLSASEGDQKV
jgi:DNA-binding NarL/FixJ family response regulator